MICSFEWMQIWQLAFLIVCRQSRPQYLVDPFIAIKFNNAKKWLENKIRTNPSYLPNLCTSSSFLQLQDLIYHNMIYSQENEIC